MTPIRVSLWLLGFCVVLAVLMAIQGGNPVKAFGIAVMMGLGNLIFAYPCLLIIGIPVMMLLRRLNLTHPVFYLVAGCWAGGIIMSAATYYLHPGHTWIDIIISPLGSAGALFGAMNGLSGGLYLRQIERARIVPSP